MTAGAPREGVRRAIHAIAGTLIAYAACCLGLSHRTVSILFAAGLAALLLLEVARQRVPAVQHAFMVMTLGAVRPEEHRRFTGGTILLTGYALAWWFFPAAAAARGIAVSALADPAASTIGMLAAPRGRKTIAGSLGALVAAFAVLAATAVPVPVALVGGVAAALLERVPGRAADNLSVPVGTALVVWLLL